MKSVVLVSVVIAAFGVGRYSKSTYSSGPTKEPTISSSDAGVSAEGMRVTNRNEDADVGMLARGLLEKSSDVNFWQRRLAIFHSATLPQPNAIAKPVKTELKPLMDGDVLSVGADGVLNSVALALLRISDDQAKRIQEAMDLAKLKLFKLATSYTKIDKLRTTETTSAFTIPSFEAEGIQIREEFETEIKKVLPPEIRDDFLQFFPFHQFAGGFGSNEILLEMVPSDVGDSVTGFQAKFEFRDAAGQVSTSGFMPMSKVKEQFGVGFNIEN